MRSTSIAVLAALLSMIACTEQAPEPPAAMPQPPATESRAAPAHAAPSAGETTVIGPLTGVQAPLHPDNLAPHRIAYYGTDLGWTYEHNGQLHMLFGDTMANEIGDPIEPSNGGRFDDSYGSIDLARWNQPETFTRENMPVVKLGQNPGSSEMAAIDPGLALELFKTPVAGFSNGVDEFGIFYTYKPLGCTSDADCPNGTRCDTGLGYFGEPWTVETGLTMACVDGSSPACMTSTLNDAAGQPIADSGFCNDPASTLYADTPVGRTSTVAVKQLIATRDRSVPKKYHTDHTWQTSRFMNPAVRTVASFTPPAQGAEFAPDYRPASSAGPLSRVFVWGRPHFIGMNASGRGIGQYYAFVDLPAGAGYDWKPQYFAGLDEHGLPRFSPNEGDAVPADLDDSVPGLQAEDAYDVVNQVSIAWIPQISKWLMIYSGGITKLPIEPALPKCGVLELFAAGDCDKVEIGNGAFRMRTADHPWGPWTPAQDILVAGDPAVAVGQYGPGGMLRHPDCTAPDCAPHTASRDLSPKEYGFFYSANIIEQWTRPAGDGVDVIWNASTWDPYRVILLRTRINP